MERDGREGPSPRGFDRPALKRSASFGSLNSITPSVGRHVTLSTENVIDDHGFEPFANKIDILKVNSGYRDEKRYLPTIDDVVLVNQSTTWQNVIVPDEQPACCTTLKFLIRKGIPDARRPRIWKIVSGISRLQQENPHFYVHAAQRTFGEKVPPTVSNVPLFGGSLKPQNYYLTEQGVNIAKRILCVYAMENPQIEYLPIIPDLLLLLLHFFTEADAYAALYLMTTFTSKDTKYFLPTKKESFIFLYTFDDLLKQLIPKLHLHMKSIKVSSQQLVEKWFVSLFVGTLSLQCVFRILDVIFSEGKKVLFRIGLGLLKICKHKLLHCTSLEEMVHTIEQQSLIIKDDDLFKVAFSMRLQRKEMRKLSRKNSDLLRGQVEEPHSSIYYRPKISFQSRILRDEHFETIWGWLPHRFVIKDPALAFAASENGYSLNNLLNQVEDRHPLLLVFRTKNKEAFGAFVTQPLRKWNKYYGDRECFVWRINPTPEKFGWIDGCNEHFVFVDNNFIQIGGEKPALVLDSDLWVGRTQPSGTFKSPPLSDLGETFHCVHCEVYYFK